MIAIVHCFYFLVCVQRKGEERVDIDSRALLQHIAHSTMIVMAQILCPTIFAYTYPL